MLVLISILAWIVVIGTFLHWLFGAHVSTGWAIAAGFFTMAAICILVMLKELVEVFVVPKMPVMSNRYEDARKALGTGPWDDRLIDPSTFGQRRAELGLADRPIPQNRQKKSAGGRSAVKRVEPASYPLDGLAN
ncbi:MAG: hypothetical protein V4689_18090 [Verrucomicrobiota bacterium]